MSGADFQVLEYAEVGSGAGTLALLRCKYGILEVHQK